MEIRLTYKTVWAKTITTPYTANFSDSFLAVERLKMANEGAIRANLTQMVNDLVALKARDLTVSVR